MKRLVLPILLAAALLGADSRIMPGMNAFTTDAYKQLAGGDANLILSPFNIATALSMASAGALASSFGLWKVAWGAVQKPWGIYNVLSFGTLMVLLVIAGYTGLFLALMTLKL